MQPLKLNFNFNFNLLFSRILHFDTFKRYLETNEGPLGYALPMSVFVPTTKESEQYDWPEIQLHIIPLLLGSNTDLKKAFSIDDKIWSDYLVPGMKGKEGISFTYCLLRPKSRLHNHLHIYSVSEKNLHTYVKN